jgi:hypothetical protein
MSSVEELIAAANPRTTEPYPFEIDAALQRVLARSTEPASADPPASRHSRPRHVVPAAALAAAAAVAAAVVLTGIGHTRAGSGASTRNPGASAGHLSTTAVIRRMTNVISGSGTGILHLVETDSYGLVGGPQTTYSGQSWTQQDGQHAYWGVSTCETGCPAGGSIREAVMADHWTDLYFPQTNTIEEVNSGPPIWGSRSPLDLGLVAMGVQAAADANFAAQVTALLHDPKVTVNWNARFEGYRAIRFYSAARQSTLYVQPGSYRPLAVVMTSHANGHRYQQVTVFRSIQTLLDGSVPIPDLARLYPTARVVVATP